MHHARMFLIQKSRSAPTSRRYPIVIRRVIAKKESKNNSFALKNKIMLSKNNKFHSQIFLT